MCFSVEEGCGGIPALVSQVAQVCLGGAIEPPSVCDRLFPRGPYCGGSSLVPLLHRCVSSAKGTLRHY